MHIIVAMTTSLRTPCIAKIVLEMSVNHTSICLLNACIHPRVTCPVSPIKQVKKCIYHLTISGHI